MYVAKSYLVIKLVVTVLKFTANEKVLNIQNKKEYCSNFVVSDKLFHEF
jgi:hypothetical protein